ncbi:gamma-glutamyl hydrolase 2-like [Momordica charantia]|uniref:folate gamma-glutamyl hydrolase n=1 Tax=Momordica charantia TaxID=3673 RepID=A0A6J1C402_MOMCH|nr:gamma-glutamyl hydrolase 2-like [Momordica charantia]
MLPEVVGFAPTISEHSDRSFHSSSPSIFSSSSISVYKYFWVSFLILFTHEFRLVNAVHPFPNILMPSQFGLDSSAVAPSCTAMDPKLNYQPVIGILSHPGDGASGRLSNATNASYIAASYVKFVESAGARVIPLIYNEPLEILFEKLNLVNGVLFTGGWAKEGLYYSVAEKIFKKILERNDAGDHFPLHAVCLGFEILSMIISKDRNILESFNSSNMASTLDFVDNVNIKGTVFQRFPRYLLEKLSTDCIVMQNHLYGISPGRFEQNAELSRFFGILTTSNDEDNKVYVSTVHARNYPVTAFQWHPEKNAFEWGSSVIPHTENAIEVTQHVANHFISEARKSLNRPSAQKVLDSLIYNYIPTFGGKAGKGFDEVYIFT